MNGSRSVHLDKGNMKLLVREEAAQNELVVVEVDKSELKAMPIVAW